MQNLAYLINFPGKVHLLHHRSLVAEENALGCCSSDVLLYVNDLAALQKPLQPRPLPNNDGEHVRRTAGPAQLHKTKILRQVN